MSIEKAGKSNDLPAMAEMKRFELLHRLPGLPHFECGPFNHLGTSPYIFTSVFSLIFEQMSALGDWRESRREILKIFDFKTPKTP